MKGIPNRLKLYITVLSLSAIALLAYLSSNYKLINSASFLVFSILMIIAETFLIQLPGIGAVSVSFALSFAAIIISGPLTAALITAIGLTFRRPYVEGRGYVHIFNSPPYKTIYNASQSILCAGLSGILYIYIQNNFAYLGVVADTMALVLTVIAYVILNTSIMTLLIKFLNGGKIIAIWGENFKGVFLNAAAIGLLGIIVAFTYNNYGIGSVVLFFVPLLLARYSFKLYVDMRKNYMETVKALINAVEAKDPYTSGHASRVGKYAVEIGKELGLTSFELDKIRNAALLHDIGKIGVDDRILNKNKGLNNLEYEVIKNHPSTGYEIIKEIEFLKGSIDIVKHHHERWDGKGYPDGLKGEEISQLVSILTIADSFDAMTTDRPYRKAFSFEKAVFEIENNAGTQFNPNIVDDAIKALGKCVYVDKVNKEMVS
ncbi:MAG: HD-GYP domain-containing protein [Bacillota bacterium]|nr:HD-GYP domain-containing protein [Bacillota bacterium]